MILISSARTSQLGATADNPFVAFNNVAGYASTTISGSDPVKTDGARENAVSGTTYDYWRPDISGTSTIFRITLPAARALTFCAITGHNLSNYGITAEIQKSTDNGVTWTGGGAGTYAPTDNSPIAWRMYDDGVGAKDWRLRLTATDPADNVYIANIFMGNEVVIASGFYDGFAPPIYPTEVQLQSNVSVGGNLLGSSIVATGTHLSATFSHLAPARVRSTLSEFIPLFNAGQPFYFAWKPATYPSDMRYCWRDGDTIKPSNAGGLDYMSFSMEMRAYES